LVKFQPVTGRWSYELMLVGLRVELQKVALYFTSTESYFGHRRQENRREVCIVSDHHQCPVPCQPIM